MTDKEKDFLVGLVTEIALQSLPVRKVYPASGDILDNEWPITWKMSEVEGNTQAKEEDAQPVIRISSLMPTKDELESISVTAVIDGETVELTFLYSEAYDGYVMSAYSTADYSFYLALASVYSVPIDMPLPSTGLYYMLPLGSDSDIQFTLTKGGA